MANSQNQTVSNKDLKERIEKLESTVKEVCYTLYELMEHLHGMQSTEQLRTIPWPPLCPPICPRQKKVARKLSAKRKPQSES